jgi:DNA modification methylase
MITSQKIKSRASTDTNLKDIRLLANDLLVETVALQDVKEPKNNSRPPSERATLGAGAMIDQWGQFMPLVVDDEGTIVFGYEFLLAARERGWATIKVIRLSNLSREHARVLSLALARLPELSSWDNVALAKEFKEILTFDLDFDPYDLTGFTVGEMDVIIENEGANDNPDPLDEAPDPPDEVVTQLGDVWVMGSHRLICGNALEAETYDRLMGPKLARMILTDPPFNIKIAGNLSGKGVVKHGEFAMASVEMSASEFTKFLKTMLMGSTARLVDGGLAFVFIDRRHLEELLVGARETGLSILDLCIWDKMNGGMSSMWRSRHEPCFVFKKGKVPHVNNIQLGKHGRYRTNVWKHRGLTSFGKGPTEALHDHLTQKPVNLLAEAIKDCTRRGDIVLDGFCGSGSTIIAAQKTGRIGFGIEFEPKYVDVSVARWEKMTGRVAILQGTEMTFANVQSMRQVGKPQAGPSPATGQ